MQVRSSEILLHRYCLIYTKEFYMKRKLLKITAVLLSYIILNAGIIGWMKVYSVSGSRAGKAEEVMAQVYDEENKGLRVKVMGNSTLIEYEAFTEVLRLPVVICMAEPVFLAAGAVYELYLRL